MAKRYGAVKRAGSRTPPPRKLKRKPDGSKDAQLKTTSTFPAADAKHTRAPRAGQVKLEARRGRLPGGRRPILGRHFGCRSACLWCRFTATGNATFWGRSAGLNGRFPTTGNGTLWTLGKALWHLGIASCGGLITLRRHKKTARFSGHCLVPMHRIGDQCQRLLFCCFSQPIGVDG